MDSQGWRYLRNGAYTVAALLSAHLLYLYYRLATSSSIARGIDNPEGFFFGWGETAGLMVSLRSQLTATAWLAAFTFAVAFLAQYKAGRAAREEAARDAVPGAGGYQDLNPPPPSS
ncbi:MAG TPA: hypothetical protein VNZ52_15175 [Candidatus Thermoplasmatota archaeon]|nr:hypothetical protein [Candidatus Thermoplasmatota archaeon]